MNSRRRIGIAGGLGPLASEDTFSKLVQQVPAARDKDRPEIIIEHQAVDDKRAVADKRFDFSGRKIRDFDTIRALEQQNLAAVLLPCFISHTFIDELESSVRVPIINLMEALTAFLSQQYPGVRRVGVLTSNHVRERKLFEKHFDKDSYELIYPSSRVQNECLMEAIYGPQGIMAGYLQGEVVKLIRQACLELSDRGAELIIPGFTEIPAIINSLQELVDIPLIDSNGVYAQFALDSDPVARPRAFKVGIVGGVGPSATADLLQKIVICTPAEKDQDHIKMIVEHDPQIPDRTEHLLGHGPDPTIALYAACKRLEEGGASLIAIPCNTAHAYVESMQQYLSIPIVNMLFETVEHLKRHHPDVKKLALLATSGTVASRIYHRAFEGSAYDLLLPDDEHQETLMEVIYGPRGIKAGYNDGKCVQGFYEVLTHMAEQGAEVIILGCTELPLLEPEFRKWNATEKRIVFVDPTSVLAKKCVEKHVT